MASTATAGRTETSISRDDDLVSCFTVGSLRCTALSDGFIVVPTVLLAAAVPPEEIRSLLSANGQDPDMLRNPISCLLVTLADGRTVIVDSGCGQVPGPDGATTPTAGRFAEAMSRAGVDPAGVETVLISHLHPDHIGGLFDAAGQPLFSNADYVVSRQEAEFWRSPANDLGGTLMPPPRRAAVIALARRFLEQAGERLVLFEAGEPAIDGVETLPLPGHTAGQVGFLFDGGDAKLLYTADAAGHPIISLLRPAWRFGFDADSAVAVETRETLVRTLVDTGWSTFTPHFPWPSFGRVEKRDDVPVWIAGTNGA